MILSFPKRWGWCHWLGVTVCFVTARFCVCGIPTFGGGHRNRSIYSPPAPFPCRRHRRSSPLLTLYPPNSNKITSMADAAGGARGGFGSRGGAGGDRGRGDRGRGRGRGRGRRGAGKNEEKEWQPVTKLGRLVKTGKIKSMEEIYLHSLPIKEYPIVDYFLPKLKDEVMKVGNPPSFLHPPSPPSFSTLVHSLSCTLLSPAELG